jgi:glycosyltransferase involved in cell wall biosynthesis
MAGAIVHEWLAPHGGSENVVEVMLQAFPDAKLYSLWNDSGSRFASHEIHESWIARTPLRRSKAASLPFMPPTWSQMRFDDAEFVLISSHAFAHHADWNNKSRTARFVYVHTPARYLWEPSMDSRGAGIAARAVSPLLKVVDKRAARQTASFAANSQFVRDRIRRVWDRDAEVIYPPVRIERVQAREDWRDVLNAREASVVESLPDGFVFGASRFVAYKRLDAVISAGEAANMPVVIAGAGPDEAALRAQAAEATVPVHFVIAPTDAMLYALYQAASVFVFLAIEDFGIMPVEAMALGTPVVVQPEGGARESVELLDAGVVSDSTDRREIAKAIDAAIGISTARAAGSAAALLGEQRFQRALQEWVSADVDREAELASR